MQVGGHMMTLHKGVGGDLSTNNVMDESSCDVCGQETIKIQVECQDITLNKPGLTLAGKPCKVCQHGAKGLT